MKIIAPYTGRTTRGRGSRAQISCGCACVVASIALAAPSPTAAHHATMISAPQATVAVIGSTVSDLAALRQWIVSLPLRRNAASAGAVRTRHTNSR